MAEYILTYEVAGGRTVTCPQCGHQHFDEGHALLNTRGFTFFNLDWANRGATVLTCRQCGRIEWFKDRPKVVQRSPLSSKT